MAQPPLDPDETPVSEIRPAAKRPLSASGKMSVIAVGIVLTIVIVAVVFSAFTGIKTNQQAAALHSSMIQRPSPTNPAGFASYDDAQLAQKLEEAQKQNQIQEAALTQACMSKGGAINHDADGKATCQLPPDDSTPDLTPAQKAAMKGGSSTGGSSTGGNDGAKSAKEQVAASVASDMLTIDLSTAKTANPATAATEQPTPKSQSAPTELARNNDQEQGDDDPGAAADGAKKNPYDFDKFSGKEYRIFEGTYIETILKNRLDGEFTGPVEVMVSTDLYSHNRQELLLPRGTVFIGTARKVGNQYQRRLAVAFHRAIMPDGFSLDLDRFIGLDQVGSAGLTGKVNHHYVQMFGSSVALGLVAGLSQIGNSTSSLGYSPSTSIRNGMSQQLGQEGEEILSKFSNVPPTITIPEGSRVRVYFSQDMPVPAYANHQVPNDL